MSETTTVDTLKALALARMAVVRAEIEALKATTSGKRATRDSLVNEHIALARRIEVLTDEINQAEQPRMFALKKELGRLARMAGGY